MVEHIFAAGPLDETVALRGIKPFNNTLFSHYLARKGRAGTLDSAEQAARALRFPGCYLGARTGRAALQCYRNRRPAPLCGRVPQKGCGNKIHARGVYLLVDTRARVCQRMFKE